MATTVFPVTMWYSTSDSSPPRQLEVLSGVETLSRGCLRALGGRDAIGEKYPIRKYYYGSANWLWVIWEVMIDERYPVEQSHLGRQTGYGGTFAEEHK